MVISLVYGDCLNKRIAVRSADPRGIGLQYQKFCQP
jgi:hypothetical protein